MNDRLTTPEIIEDDIQFDGTLRPKKLSDFIGQEQIKEILSITIEAAKMRNEALEHILLFGPPGIGKTTLSYIIANELQTDIKPTSGPVLERPADLAGMLTNLTMKDVIFIDEVHRLNHIVEEYLYPAMEDFSLDIVIDQGPSARSIRLNLEPFTLIGATTRAGLLTSPLRSRFGLSLHLDYYQIQDIYQIIIRSARILKVQIDEQGVMELAKRSRGTPRVANRLLRRVRDYAQIKADGVITKDVAQRALEMLKVDEKGLDEMDKRILTIIINNYNGGPVGIKTIAVAVGEDPGTIEEIYEPYLIQQGFLTRTQRGREVTDLTYEHFGITRKSAQPDLFGDPKRILLGDDLLTH